MRPGSRSEAAYRILLRAFPRAFRERFGSEMEHTFAELLEEARRRPTPGAVPAAWLRAAWDACARGLRERLRKGRGQAPKVAGPGSGERPLRGGDALGGWAADLRYAVRSLARKPLFLAAAAGTLSLGIGATTAIFSVVNGLLVRPLPYPGSDRLVTLFAEQRELGWSRSDVNLADAWDWRRRAGVFQDLAVFGEASFNLTGEGHPERVAAIVGTANLLGVLGAEPALGRGLRAEDAREGAPLVVVLTHGFWERRFARDPAVLEASILLDGEPATVVGVLPEDFAFLDERPDVFVPLRLDPITAPRGDHDREAVARLREGVSLTRASQAVNRVAVALQAEHPDQNEGWTVRVVGLRERLLGDVAGRASLVLLAAVGFMLLMACTNVADLLLARADGRQGEIAVRAALGAGRGRIVRQLLVESGVIALVGGALGLLVAWGGERAIVAHLPAQMPPVFRFGIDGRVLGFATGVSILTIFLFGLAPALRATSPSGGLHGGFRGGPGRRSLRFGGFLVVVQTALAVVLLVGGGVMVRSVVGMTRRDMGFDPRGVLTLGLSLPEAEYPEGPEVQAFWTRLLDGIRALPGVEAAGTVHALPLGGSNWGGTFWFEGEEDPTTTQGRPTRFDYVSPGYLQAMGVEVLAGRGIQARDGPGSPAVALVNQALVRRFMDGRDALGSRLLTSGLSEPVTVVGVVEDEIARGVEDPPEPTILLPISQRGLTSRVVAVRTSGDPIGLADAVERQIWALDPDLPPHDVQPMVTLVRARIGGFALIAALMAVFGLVSLALGAVGIYGVTAYSVGRRTREIGVRMALGADRRGVVLMILRAGFRRALVGLGLGVALALLLSRAMAGLVVGVSPSDPATFASVVTLLLGVALLGSWLPARRASGMEPVRALASE